MRLSTSALSALDAAMCGRCGRRCWLQPLRRPGAYRLLDSDGQAHAAVCVDDDAPIELPNPARSPETCLRGHDAGIFRRMAWYRGHPRQYCAECRRQDNGVRSLRRTWQRMELLGITV